MVASICFDSIANRVVPSAFVKEGPLMKVAELGGGSLTALPIIETEAQNIAAYIPTNLISITDGQLYLSPKLFELGVLPAIDVGKSVSRVGGKAQLPAYRAVAGAIKLAYAQFEELETFARFGTRLDEHTKNVIEHGKRIRECLKQNELEPVSVPGQILVLLAVTNGLLDDIPVEKIQDAESLIQRSVAGIPRDIIQSFYSDKPISKEDINTILATISKAINKLEQPGS